jgi:tetratricopeptide (TPR) repeat protein
MTEGAKFKAFISYSRQDEAAVRRLHARLEAFVVPAALRQGGKARLGRFFRDKEELSAASSLGGELAEKIASAEWLIVCCSPHSAASHWVNTEVDAFLNTHGYERTLVAVLDGEPRDVFPPRLRARNPLAADFRKFADGEDIGFLKIVAGLLNVDLGELRDRQAAAERARLRLRAALASVFALLAVGAGASAWYAMQQRARAEIMAAEAVDIGAGVVAQADALSQRLGVPTAALEELLTFAEERYDRLFERGVETPELLRRRASLYAQFSELYERAGDAEKGRARALAAIEAFEALPEGELRTLDYVRALAALGQAELAAGNEAAAISYTERAIAAGRALLADIPDAQLGRTALSGALTRLGEIHMRAGRPAQALPLFVEAIPLLEDVAKNAPEDALSQSNLIAALDWLGGAQAASGDLGAARDSFERTVALARERVRVNRDDLLARRVLGTSLMKLGQTLVDADDARAARAPLEESLAIGRTLVAADPGDADAQRQLALRLILTANVMSRLGRASPELIEEALTMARGQVRADPGNVTAKETLAQMLAVNAERLARASDQAGARGAWREAAEVRRAIRASSPPEAALPAANLAFALEMIGDSSAQLQDLDSMLAAYAEAVRMRRVALAAAPQDRQARAQLAAALHALGLSRKFAQNERGARASLDEAARVRLALADEDQNDHATGFLAVDSLQQLAVVQAASDGEAARASMERAREVLVRIVALQPRNARYRDSLRRTEEVLASMPAPGG